MVKNDALFSYVAPGNIFAWVVMPLRYVMPIREFVALNRWIIKLTHWPLLFSIFIYEKYLLASRLYEPTDLVENSGRTRTRAISFADPASRSALFSPNLRAREESGVGMQKDRALDEVFRHPPGPGTLRFQRRQERRQSQIRDWMDQNVDEDDAEVGEPLSHWPTMDSRLSGSNRLHRRMRHLSDGRSVASDPADMQSHAGFSQGGFGRYSRRQQQEQTDIDGDGDDELVTNDEDENDNDATKSETHEEEDYFTTPRASRFTTMVPSSVSSRRSIISPRRINVPISPRGGGHSRRQGMHSRTISTNTILYAPQEMARKMASPPPPEPPMAGRSRPKTGQLHKVTSPLARSPKNAPAFPVNAAAGARPRPIPAHTAPVRSSLLGLEQRRLSSMDGDLASDLGGDPNVFGAVPSSFQTQMALATGQLKGIGRGASSSRDDRESADRMTKLVLARMKTLEEGLADVVREMRIARSSLPTAHNSAEERDTTGSRTSRTSPLSTDVGGNGGGTRDHHKRRPPVSRRLTKTSRPPSIKEERGAVAPKPPRSRGKGKEVAHSSQDESENSTRGLRPRGTSF